MACNVFGTPVTDATLKGMTEYHDKVIERVDRARVALEMKNAEGKDIDARNFADKTQANAERKGIRCLIYNATGGPLKRFAVRETLGSISESPYPDIIQNGQWASFVHEKQETGISWATLWYNSTQPPQRQWSFTWNHQDTNLSAKCYAEIHPKGYYSMDSFSNQEQTLKDKILSSSFVHEVVYDGDIISGSIGRCKLPIYEVILTMTDALS